MVFLYLLNEYLLKNVPYDVFYVESGKWRVESGNILLQPVCWVKYLRVAVSKRTLQYRYLRRSPL